MDLLDKYVAALELGGAAAGPPERAVYERRMDAAAQIGLAIRNKSAADLKRLIDQEERAQGWGFLAGSQGEAAEAALSKLVYRARMSGATFAA